MRRIVILSSGSRSIQMVVCLDTLPSTIERSLHIIAILGKLLNSRIRFLRIASVPVEITSGMFPNMFRYRCLLTSSQ